MTEALCLERNVSTYLRHPLFYIWLSHKATRGPARSLRSWSKKYTKIYSYRQWRILVYRLCNVKMKTENTDRTLLSLSHSHCLSLCLTHSLTHSLSHSVSHSLTTLSHSLTHSLTHSVSQLSLTLSHTHSLSHSLSHSHSLFLSTCLSLSRNRIIQTKVSAHLMVTIQKVTSNVQIWYVPSRCACAIKTN
jgi:hypothetical protein